MSEWNKYAEAAEQGPKKLFWKVFFPILGLIIVLSITGYALGWFSEAATVTQQEFGPKAALKKYEWFKEQWQFIQKADRDIDLYRSRVAAVDSQFAQYGRPVEFPVDVRVEYNQAKQEATMDLMAVISNRNSVVRDYMAASSKFNWRLFDADENKPPEMISEITK